MDFPHGAYIVQVDNFSFGKEFYAGDIESQKELEYKIEKMIKKIQSLKEDKEMNEDKDRYSRENCLKALSKMTEEEKWSYIDEEQGMDEQVYDKDGIINRYGADEEDDAWVFDGIESGAKYFVPDYEDCGSFEDIIGDDEMVYDALSEESRKDIVDKYLNESLKETFNTEKYVPCGSNISWKAVADSISNKLGLDILWEEDHLEAEINHEELISLIEKLKKIGFIEAPKSHRSSEYSYILPVNGEPFKVEIFPYAYQDGDNIFDDLLFGGYSDSGVGVGSIEDYERDKKQLQRNLGSEPLKESLSPEEAGASGLFNDLIQREYEQLNQYDSVQITLEDQGDDRFSEILEYIKDDLNIHIGMLQSCLDDITGSGEQVDQGEAQADQVLGEGIEKSDKMPLDESLFEGWYDEPAVYNYPDELIRKTYDFAKELDPYDFEDSFDEWVDDICEVHPDDIIQQTEEQTEINDDYPELYELGKDIIRLAQEFKKSIGME